jgi:Family of unknown function (DUF6064)
MSLPFTAAQFLDVFARYNRTVWPMQDVLLFLAVVALAAALRPGPRSDRLVAGILAFLWLWMAAAYHLAFFLRINPAAGIFAALFAIQAGLLVRTAFVRRELSFRLAGDGRSVLAALLIAYALVGYPLVAALAGQRYPATATFGLPCPTTIFTLGLFVAARRCPRHLLLIPAAWSLVGSSAAWSLGMTADYGLGIAGLLGTAVAARRASEWSHALQ